MKPKILLLAVLLLAAVAAPAQLRIPKPVWGVKAGVNVSGMRNYPVAVDSRTDAYMGVFAEWALGAFAISPELIYSREGMRSPDLMPLSEGVYTLNGDRMVLRTQYLQLPVALKWYWGNVSLDAGLQYGVLLGTSGSFEGDNYGLWEGGQGQGHISRTRINSSVLGGFYGASWTFTHLALNLRVVHSLTPVFRDTRGNSVTFQFGAAWAF